METLDSLESHDLVLIANMLDEAKRFQQKVVVEKMLLTHEKFMS